MSRAVAPSLVWENDDGADRAGSFTVRLESPHQWRLEDGGTTVGTYPTNTTARNAAVELHRRRAIRRRLRRHRVIGSVSLLVLVLVSSQRTEPNPDYPRHGPRPIASMPPGLTAEIMWPTWEDALPDEERSPVWFLPTFIIAFGVLFRSLVRATTVRLSFRR